MERTFKVELAGVRFYGKTAEFLRAAKARNAESSRFTVSGLYCPRHQVEVSLTSPLTFPALSGSSMEMNGQASCGCAMNVTIAEHTEIPPFDADNDGDD